MNMPINPPSVLLFECLHERNLSVSLSDLLKDIDSGSEDSFRTWITETLDSKTLLTKEELILFNSLQELDEVKLLQSSQDLGQVQAFDNYEIQTAISQLQTSTATIDKQNEILKIQQTSVSALAATEAQQRQERSIANSVQHRSWRESLDRINANVEEVASGLSEYASGSKAQCAATDAALTDQSSDILRSDDKILSSLQKLSGTLQYSLSSENCTFERIRKLCASLIKYTVERVRLRLDRVYMENLDGYPVEKNDIFEGEPEVTELQAELDSLYSEILPVAQMSTEQRYLDCAVRAIASQDKQGLEKSMKVIDYMSRSTTFLTNRLVAFKGHVEAYQKHIATLSAIVKILGFEIDSVNIYTSEDPGQVQSPRQPRNFKPLSPNRSRAAPRRRSSSSSVDDSVPPEQQILRILGVSPLEGLFRDRALETGLHEIVSDKMQKLKAHEQSLQASSESAIGEHLQDAFATLQLLSDTMLSETKHHDIRLLDEEVHNAILGLEHELANMSGCLESLDIESMKQRNSHKEALIERWDH